MGWLNNAVPNIWQWIGMFATFLGTGMAVWAALAAKGARRQAQEAKEAALGWGLVLQMTDLLNDVQELQLLVTRKDFEGVAWKSSMLRGRIVRLKSTAYNRLDEARVKSFDRARDHFEAISDVALNKRLKEDTRQARIQLMFGLALEILNQIVAEERNGSQEIEQ